MTRLLLVEWRRLFARRLTRLTVLVVMLGTLATGVGLALTSNRDVEGARAEAVAMMGPPISQEQWERDRAGCLEQVGADLEANPELFGPGATAESVCGPEQVPPQQIWIDDPRFSFHDNAVNLVRTGAVVGALVGILLAASAIGAEWQAGTLAALLTWEPRRLRVMAAKVVAPVAGTVAITVAGTGLLLVAAAAAAGTRGELGAIGRPDYDQATGQPTTVRTTGVLGDALALGGRGLLLVVLLTLTAAALAMVLRHTVAVLGVIGAYVVVAEVLLGSLQGGTFRYHLLGARALALLNGEERWYGESIFIGSTFTQGTEHVITALPAGLVLATVAAVVTAGSALWFRSRDVA